MLLVSDFETRAGENAEREGKTWVWAWAICKLEDIENVEVGTSIESWFEYIEKLPGKNTVFFHNLKFDGEFILHYLLTHNFKYNENARKMTRGEFATLIDESGHFYSISWENKAGGTIDVWDSLKKIPSSVNKIAKDFKTKYQKLTIDYVLDRNPNETLTNEEIEYVKNDVRVIAEAMHGLEENGLSAMTIGGDCLAYFKQMLGQSKNNDRPTDKALEQGKKIFRDFYPVLDKEEDAFVREAYKGGFCYCNKEGHFENCNGYVYDVNSLYPYVMHSSSGSIYPYLPGVYFKGKPTDKHYPLFVVRVSVSCKLKDKHIPAIMVRNSCFNSNIEYLEETLGGPKEVTLTSVDLKLLFDFYEIDSLEYIDGYYYAATKGTFDKYIEHWMDIKKNSTGTMRQIAKLMLNNLYGKFGQKIKGGNREPYIGEKGRVSYYKAKPQEREGNYVPVAAFCTAYARNYTIRNAQLNYDNLCYCDTDSMHTLAKVNNINVHPKNLGAWKNEKRFNEAYFLRQKTYIEHVTHEDEQEVTPHYTVTACGMNQASKDFFIQELETNPKAISKFPTLEIDGLKLRPKHIDGGIILENTSFKIRKK